MFFTRRYALTFVYLSSNLLLPPPPGIGSRIAFHLARMGAKVIMACRSMDRGEGARTKMTRELSTLAARTTLGGVVRAGTLEVRDVCYILRSISHFLPLIRFVFDYGVPRRPCVSNQCAPAHLLDVYIDLLITLFQCVLTSICSCPCIRDVMRKSASKCVLLFFWVGPVGENFRLVGDGAIYVTST